VAEAGRRRVNWRSIATNYAAVAVLIGFIVVFSLTEPETFPTLDNFKSIVASQSVLGLLALAAVPPLVVGEFDISIASMLGLAAVLSAKLAEGSGVVLIILIVLAAGLFVGAVNAFLVVKVQLNSFVATLGTSTILTGFGTLIASGETIYEGIGSNILDLASTEVWFMPIGGWYVLVAATALWYVLQHTSLGREMYATGYGRLAARLAGIRTERRIVFAFMLSGFLAAAAGFLNTASLGSATAGVGAGYLLPAFAAAFLGATTIRAGRFNVWGTVLGLILLAVGITGLQLAGAENYVQDMFNGVALIVAVTLARIGTLNQRPAEEIDEEEPPAMADPEERSAGLTG
jgi:ribose transport system permease protein